MIEKIKVLELIDSALEGGDKFLVNLKIAPGNRIYVDIDGDAGVTIDDCVALSRAIEGGLNRDEEDFELMVSSAGADQPLKMARQYPRHIGRTLDVELMTGESIVGEMTAADGEGFSIHVKGTKKSKPRDLTIAYADAKRVVVALPF